ncbi:hypothetical protein ACL03H_15545 [Saccharopolyspora sp. MS10]|uniref:hypothetical protein n=1 Tax=Saccharopolyspora sp. MS10 TaxID=3385973 RepID=UPI0039A21085
MRVSARPLFDHADSHVSPGDEIDLVERDRADRTALVAVLSGATAPSSGAVERIGSAGHPAPSPRAEGREGAATDRLRSPRGVAGPVGEIRAAEAVGAEPATATRAEARARDGGSAQPVAHLGLSRGVPGQRPDAVSDGRGGRVDLVGLLLAGHDALLLDVPANDLDPGPGDEIPRAGATCRRSIALGTGDDETVGAPRPGRAPLLPDGTEGLREDEHLDLVPLA